MSNLQAEEYKSFEEIKKIREDGTEYWNVRELSEVLQYKKYIHFLKIKSYITKKMKNSWYKNLYHEKIKRFVI